MFQINRRGCSTFLARLATSPSTLFQVSTPSSRTHLDRRSRQRGVHDDARQVGFRLPAEVARQHLRQVLVELEALLGDQVHDHALAGAPGRETGGGNGVTQSMARGS